MYKCDTCGSELRMIEELDTYVCDKCDAWMESKCSDKDCQFCTKRLDKPSQHQAPTKGSE